MILSGSYNLRQLNVKEEVTKPFFSPRFGSKPLKSHHQQLHYSFLPYCERVLDSHMILIMFLVYIIYGISSLPQDGMALRIQPTSSLDSAIAHYPRPKPPQIMRIRQLEDSYLSGSNSGQSLCYSTGNNYR
jgi:hypothetical protein